MLLTPRATCGIFKHDSNQSIMIPVALQYPHRRAVNGRPAADPAVRNRIEGKRLR